MKIEKEKKRERERGIRFLAFPSLAVLVMDGMEEALEELGSVGGRARGVPKKDNRFNSFKKGEMRVS